MNEWEAGHLNLLDSVRDDKLVRDPESLLLFSNHFFKKLPSLFWGHHIFKKQPVTFFFFFFNWDVCVGEVDGSLKGLEEELNLNIHSFIHSANIHWASRTLKVFSQQLCRIRDKQDVNFISVVYFRKKRGDWRTLAKKLLLVRVPLHSCFYSC